MISWLQHVLQILAYSPYWLRHFEESYGDQKDKHRTIFPKNFMDWAPWVIYNYWTPWDISINTIPIIYVNKHIKVYNTYKWNISLIHATALPHQLAVLCRASAVVQVEWMEGGWHSWRTNGWVISEVIDAVWTTQKIIVLWKDFFTELCDEDGYIKKRRADIKAKKGSKAGWISGMLFFCCEAQCIHWYIQQLMHVIYHRIIVETNNNEHCWYLMQHIINHNMTLLDLTVGTGLFICGPCGCRCVGRGRGEICMRLWYIHPCSIHDSDRLSIQHAL